MQADCIDCNQYYREKYLKREVQAEEEYPDSKPPEVISATVNRIMIANTLTNFRNE